MRRRPLLPGAALAAALAVPSSTPAGATGQAQERAHPGNWVTAWAASPVTGVIIPFNPGCRAGEGFTDLPCWLLVDGIEVRAPARVTGTGETGTRRVLRPNDAGCQAMANTVNLHQLLS